MEYRTWCRTTAPRVALPDPRSRGRDGADLPSWRVFGATRARSPRRRVSHARIAASRSSWCAGRTAPSRSVNRCSTRTLVARRSGAARGPSPARITAGPMISAARSSGAVPGGYAALDRAAHGLPSHRGSRLSRFVFASLHADGPPSPGTWRRHALIDRSCDLAPGARSSCRRAGQASLRRQLEDAAGETTATAIIRLRARRALQAVAPSISGGRPTRDHQGGGAGLGRRPHRDRMAPGYEKPSSGSAAPRAAVADFVAALERREGGGGPQTVHGGARTRIFPNLFMARPISPSSSAHGRGVRTGIPRVSQGRAPVQ